MTTHPHCRHRRPRHLLVATFAAAVLVLVFATGTRVGVIVGSLDAQHRVDSIGFCEATP